MEDKRLAIMIPLAEADAYFSEEKLEHLYDKYGKEQLINDTLDAINMTGKYAEEYSISDLKDIVSNMLDMIAMETNKEDAWFYVVDAEAETELTYLNLWDPDISQNAEYGDILLFVPISGIPETTPEVCHAVDNLYGCVLRDTINIANAMWIIHHEDDEKGE